MSEPLYAEGAAGYDQMFARITAAFIRGLLAAAHLAPGQRVLDVATGTGAAAAAAMELVGPDGEVIAGDISPAMLEVARRNPSNQGIRFEQFDGHAVPFPAHRFDRVICELGLAFFTDPTQGLAEFRRVLAPGGWAAVCVNSTPERSLFARIGTVIGQHVPEKAERLDSYASIRTLERLAALFNGAGFADVAVHSTVHPFSFASFDDYFASTEAGHGLSGQEFVKLPDDLRRAVRADVRTEFGINADATPFVVEMEVLIGAGRA